MRRFQGSDRSECSECRPFRIQIFQIFQTCARSGFRLFRIFRLSPVQNSDFSVCFQKFAHNFGIQTFQTFQTWNRFSAELQASDFSDFHRLMFHLCRARASPSRCFVFNFCDAPVLRLEQKLFDSECSDSSQWWANVPDADFAELQDLIGFDPLSWIQRLQNFQVLLMEARSVQIQTLRKWRPGTRLVFDADFSDFMSAKGAALIQTFQNLCQARAMSKPTKVKIQTRAGNAGVQIFQTLETLGPRFKQLRSSLFQTCRSR